MTFQEQYSAEQAKAVQRLLDWAGGSVSQLAACACVTRKAVYKWIEQGRVSRAGAVRLAKFPGCPLSKEEMRPDILVWPADSDITQK